MRRRAEGDRWDGELMKQIRGTPQTPDPNTEGIEVPVRVEAPSVNVNVVPQELRPPRVEETPRRVYLKPKDFVKHGYTEGWEGCRRLRTGNMSFRPHNEECRSRLEAALKAEDNQRWRRASDRRRCFGIRSGRRRAG